MCFLISSLTTALCAAACAQGLGLDRARSVRFSMPGWTEEKPQEGLRVWRNADGDVLSMGASSDPLTVFDWSSETQVRQFARQLAEAAGGGLIEAAAVAPPPRAIVRLIYKRLIGPAYIYTGMLVMAGGRVPIFWTVVAGERGMTGVREAVITAEMMSAGELTSESYKRHWAQDPYDPAYQGVDRSVLRFLSDDERYDARFPQHPLSKVRRALAGIPAGVTGLQ